MCHARNRRFADSINYVKPSPLLKRFFSTVMQVKVSGTITVNYVSEVNDAKQTVTSKYFMMLNWTDDALTWNTSDFRDVSFLELPLHAAWTPYIFVITDNGNYDVLDSSVKHVYVFEGGLVIAYESFTVHTPCAMDLARFPYDTQVNTGNIGIAGD
jgi:hypothetical protein